MAVVKSVNFDGESIHIFRSAIYLFETSNSLTLELEMIVSEIVLQKYKKIDNLIVEIELEDGAIIHSIMHVKVLPGRLPLLHLYCDWDDLQAYPTIDRMNEQDDWFPNIEEGITLEEIRKVEMPIEDINIKLKLPIDQVEWLKKQKKKELNQLFLDFIYELWEKRDPGK